jgi:hypothetical protein
MSENSDLKITAYELALSVHLNIHSPAVNGIPTVVDIVASDVLKDAKIIYNWLTETETKSPNVTN